MSSDYRPDFLAYPETGFPPGFGGVPMRSGLEGLPRDLLPIRPSRACSTCVFSAYPENAPLGSPLQCRRHPPVVNIVKLKAAGLPPGLDLGGLQQPDELLQALTNFPSVQPDEWCGEHESTAEPTAVDS